MNLIFLIVGVGLGYFFKPQIEPVVRKAVKAIKDNSKKNKRDDDY